MSSIRINNNLNFQIISNFPRTIPFRQNGVTDMELKFSFSCKGAPLGISVTFAERKRIGNDPRRMSPRRRRTGGLDVEGLEYGRPRSCTQAEGNTTKE